MDYNKILSKKVLEVKPSGIRKFFDIVSEMENVISLGVGEPDFTTPNSIKQSAIQSLNLNQTNYSSNWGFLELRDEICKYLDRRFNLSYDYKDEVVVTVGASEAIDMCVRALIEQGDEVLIPEPCYVSYSPIVHLSGGVCVPIETKVENKFIVTPEDLKDKITNKTKLLILNYPNNPTGAVMRKKQLQAVADVIKETDIIVLTDEIYSELTYGEKHYSFANIDGMKERTILINGFSKAYSMTGWRLGYACGPSEIIKQMTKIHQYAIMCAPSISQYAAIDALKNCDDSVQEMKKEYDERRHLVVKTFNEMGLPCFEPEGAFYVFPNIKSIGLSSEQFAEKILYNKKVAVVPGNAFGQSGEGFIRVSYSYSKAHLIEAMDRIKEFINEFKG